MSEPAPALDILDVHRRFGATEVLRGVTLRIPAGQRVALIGPNGAGKSTLFDLVSGRGRPSRGEIRLHGRRIDGLAPEQVRVRGLSRSFQGSQLFARLSAFENLRCAVLCAQRRGGVFWRFLESLGDVREQAEALLGQVGLQSRRDVPAMHLAYAEQRALEIGLTLAGGPGVILLDEPTAGMSRSQSEGILQLIRQASEGRTLLVVEHDMEVVFDLADRIAVLDQGELVAFDTPEAIRANPRVRQAYLGAMAPGAGD